MLAKSSNIINKQLIAATGILSLIFGLSFSLIYHYKQEGCWGVSFIVITGGGSLFFLALLLLYF